MCGGGGLGRSKATEKSRGAEPEGMPYPEAAAPSTEVDLGGPKTFRLPAGLSIACCLVWILQ